MSPALMKPNLRISSEIAREITAGSRKQMSTSPVQSSAVTVSGYSPPNQPRMIPMGPSIPQVPIPELIAAPYILILKTQVARGPVTAAATVGGKVA